MVVTDLKMSGMDGMELFRSIQQRDYHLPVIVLTAHGTIPDAVSPLSVARTSKSLA